MSQKNVAPKKTYYQTFHQRSNIIKTALTALFSTISHTGRFLLEVFIRKNLGERYFSFPLAIILTIILAVIPYAIEASLSFGRVHLWELFWGNVSWYAYLIAFMFFCLKRKKEIKRLPSVFDFERFSLSTGEIHPKFYEFSVFGEKGDKRKIETLLEPALFFVIGVVLILLKQKIGVIITLSSILYSLSYVIAYIEGDHFIMDKIDEMICNEGLVQTFVEGKTNNYKGFSSYGRRPVDNDNRKKLYEEMVDDPNYVDFS
jgi:hypothetical protein